MVYASTLRHECMGVHTSERAITFFASPSQAEAPIMVHAHTHMCIFRQQPTRNRAGAISGAFERGSAG